MKFFNFLSILASLFFALTYDFPENKTTFSDYVIKAQMNQTNLKTVGLTIVSHNSTLYKKFMEMILKLLLKHRLY